MGRGLIAVLALFLLVLSSLGAAAGVTSPPVLAQDGPLITGIDPPSASAGTNSVVTITGCGFGSSPGFVSFYYRHKMAASPGYVLSWSDTSIEVMLPPVQRSGYAMSISSGPVTVARADGEVSNSFPFEVTFGYAGHKWPGDHPVVDIYVNPNTEDCSGEEIAVQKAIDTWNAVPGKNITLRYAGLTGVTSVEDANGLNEIIWRDMGSIEQGHAVPRIDNSHILEVDIELNDYYQWNTIDITPGSQFDVQSVVLHEMGHLLGLRDLYGYEPGFPQDEHKVMSNPSCTLAEEDMAGIQWIYSSASATPSVVTAEAADITAVSASLHGLLLDKGGASTVYISFDWGTGPGHYYETPLQAVSATGPFSFNLTGLTPDTTYKVDVKALGGGGFSLGNVISFKTASVPVPEPPSVSTLAANDIHPSSAVLKGSLTALGSADSVEVSFQYDTLSRISSGDYASETPPQTLTAEAPFAFDLAHLSPDTDYYFRAKAVGEGIAYGREQSFHTLAVDEPPSVTTFPAIVEYTQATLRGYLDSPGSSSSATVGFDYGTSEQYGLTTRPQKLTGPGPFSANLAGLKPNTTYHFRARAAGQGTTYAEDVTFRTQSPPLAVTTRSPSSLSSTSAVLNGNLSCPGDNSTVSVFFQWGTTIDYDRTSSPPQTLAKAAFFKAGISGLEAGRTYHYRAVAAGENETVYGEDISFVAKKPSSTGPQRGGGGGGGSAPSQTAVTLSGLGSASSLVTDASGVVKSPVRLENEDRTLLLDIPRGTSLQDAAGQGLTSLSAAECDPSPPPPDDAAVLSAFNLGPEGAAFNPPLSLTFRYDPSALPPSSGEEDLFLASWNGTEWQALDSSPDIASGTVSAPIAHFSPCALLVELPLPRPAGFIPDPATAAPAAVRPESPSTAGTKVRDAAIQPVNSPPPETDKPAEISHAIADITGAPSPEQPSSTDAEMEKTRFPFLWIALGIFIVLGTAGGLLVSRRK
jgi:hypothetical protein